MCIYCLFFICLLLSIKRFGTTTPSCCTPCAHAQSSILNCTRTCTRARARRIKMRILSMYGFRLHKCAHTHSTHTHTIQNNMLWILCTYKYTLLTYYYLCIYAKAHPVMLLLLCDGAHLIYRVNHIYVCYAHTHYEWKDFFFQALYSCWQKKRNEKKKSSRRSK